MDDVTTHERHIELRRRKVDQLSGAGMACDDLTFEVEVQRVHGRKEPCWEEHVVGGVREPLAVWSGDEQDRDAALFR